MFDFSERICAGPWGWHEADEDGINAMADAVQRSTRRLCKSLVVDRDNWTDEYGAPGLQMLAHRRKP